MKIFKQGFTLAEVLITMALIGVVASMTLPTLSVNVQKQQIGPALAKAINTLESANRLALQTENVRTLNQLPNATNGYLEAMRPYIQYSYVGSIKRPYTGTTHTNTHRMYSTKDGIDYIYENSNPARIQDNVNYLPISYSGSYYNNIQIDVNGNNKGPNALGRDLFVVIVDTKGVVIPYGGEAYSQYSSATSAIWKNGVCDSPKATFTDMAACTGSIVDNGYKVIY